MCQPIWPQGASTVIINTNIQKRGVSLSGLTTVTVWGVLCGILFRHRRKHTVMEVIVQEDTLLETHMHTLMESII